MDILTIQEAVASGFGSRSSIYRALSSGELIGRKRGRRTVFFLKDLNAWASTWPTIGDQGHSAVGVRTSNSLAMET